MLDDSEKLKRYDFQEVGKEESVFWLGGHIGPSWTVGECFRKKELVDE